MPRGRPTTKSFSIPQLERLLDQQRSELDKLHREKESLQQRIEQIDQQISDLSGDAAVQRAAGRTGGSRSGTSANGRARNKKSLPNVIENVLQKAGGGPMRVSAIVDAVHRGGYRSTSANFRSIVNQALIKDDRFQQAGRGMYMLKQG